MKLTKKKAIELSILKWEWIVKNDGSEKGLIDAIPELEKLKAHCGLCELYVEDNTIRYCYGCPICPKKWYNLGCMKSGHKWYIWSNNPTKENAQKVLDLIKSIK